MSLMKFAITFSWFLFLFLADSRAGHSQAQTDSTYRCFAPVMSPDGNSAAYYAQVNGNWDVYIYDLESGEIERLTENGDFDGEPAFAQGGDKLVFTSDRDGDDELFIVNLETNLHQKITDDTIHQNMPLFTPDGKGLIFCQKLDSAWYPFLLNISTGHRKQLSERAVEGRMRWSTNNESISYVTPLEEGFALGRIDLSGRLLTLTMTGFDYPGNPHYNDQISSFVFDGHADKTEQSGDGLWEIWTIGVDGENLTRITDNTLDDWGAYWSKDGKSIIYSGNGYQGIGYEILLLELDGGKIRPLTSKAKD